MSGLAARIGEMRVHITPWLAHDGKIHIGPDPTWPWSLTGEAPPALFAHCLECADKYCRDNGMSRDPTP